MRLQTSREASSIDNPSLKTMIGTRVTVKKRQFPKLSSGNSISPVQLSYPLEGAE